MWSSWPLKLSWLWLVGATKAWAGSSHRVPKRSGLNKRGLKRMSWHFVITAHNSPAIIYMDKRKFVHSAWNGSQAEMQCQLKHQLDMKGSYNKAVQTYFLIDWFSHFLFFPFWDTVFWSLATTLIAISSARCMRLFNSWCWPHLEPASVPSKLPTSDMMKNIYYCSEQQTLTHWSIIISIEGWYENIEVIAGVQGVTSSKVHGAF